MIEFLPGAETAGTRLYRAITEYETSVRAVAETRSVALARLLVHCAKHVPFYKGISVGDFYGLPVLARSTFQERAPEFVATPLHYAASKIVGEWHTSGTSGVPVRGLATRRTAAFFEALHLRDVAWTVDPMFSSLAIRYQRRRLDRPVTLDHWPGLSRLIKTGSAVVADINTEIRELCELLVATDPACLIAHPSTLIALAEVLPAPMRNLRVIKSVSEEISAEDQAFVESRLGAKLAQTYSAFETGYIATSCPDGPGLHVHDENVLLEILDDAGEPCAIGEVGRVVLTTLQNFATPLLRYDIGDRAARLPPCPCGRALSTIDRPLGKIYPNFLTASGWRSTMDLAVAMRKIGGFRQFQIVQRPAWSVGVSIVPHPGWNRDSDVRSALAKFFGYKVEVDIEHVAEILRQPGGKVRSIRCEVAR